MDPFGWYQGFLSLCYKKSDENCTRVHFWIFNYFRHFFVTVNLKIPVVLSFLLLEWAFPSSIATTSQYLKPVIEDHACFYHCPTKGIKVNLLHAENMLDIQLPCCEWKILLGQIMAKQANCLAASCHLHCYCCFWCLLLLFLMFPWPYIKTH